VSSDQQEETTEVTYCVLYVQKNKPKCYRSQSLATIFHILGLKLDVREINSSKILD
jgi:hypothetical protein